MSRDTMRLTWLGKSYKIFQGYCTEWIEDKLQNQIHPRFQKVGFQQGLEYLKWRVGIANK